MSTNVGCMCDACDVRQALLTECIIFRDVAECADWLNTVPLLTAFAFLGSYHACFLTNITYIFI